MPGRAWLTMSETYEVGGVLSLSKLLDAVWYGVPQYRTRFFVFGVHRDVGYKPDDFGNWAPFPLPTHGPGAGNPYVTVREAIGDLPPIGNGDPLDDIPVLSEASSERVSQADATEMRR